MDNHRNKTIAGFTWSAIGQVGTEASKFLIGIFLARILGPEAFGLIGMVLVFTGMANIVLQFGFAEALIQRKEVKDSDWSTVFWINLAAGIIIAAIVASLSPLIASFYEEPKLLAITLVLSLNFPLQSLALVQRAQMTKFMEFKKLAKVDVAGFAGSGILALIAAFMDFGVWSLVIQHVSRSMIMTVLLWAQSIWRPRWEFDQESLKSYASLSIYMFFYRFLGHISLNIDSLLIGKVLGKETLGHYNRAFFFMLFPVNSFTNVITKVLFPSMSSIQDDQAKVASVFQKMIGVVSFIIFPVMTVLLVFAEPLVMVLFGQEWEPMIPYLQVFSLLGMAATLSTLTTTAVMAMGQKKLLGRIIVLENSIVIAATFIGIYWGVWGILIGKILISFVILFFKIRWAAQSLRLPNRAITAPLFLPLVMSAIMGGGLWAATTIWNSFYTPLHIYVLLAGLPLSLIVYLFLAKILKPTPMRELIQLLLSKGVPVPSVLRV